MSHSAKLLLFLFTIVKFMDLNSYSGCTVVFISIGKMFKTKFAVLIM